MFSHKNSWRFIAALIAAVMIASFAGDASAASRSSANPIVPIVKSASPAVVNIDVETKAKQRSSRGSFFPFEDDPFFKQFFGDMFGDRDYGRPAPMKGRGSGFIVTKDGRIITNNHVVDGVDTIKVTLTDGTTYDAKVVGKDPTFDIAIIKIEPKSDLPVLELGDSDEIEVGEMVVAIGNPYGLEHTVTAGIISAKNRSIHTREVNFDGLLQTDAAVNPGNSGGPLLDMDGKVIGINAAIVPYAQGLCFAIPVNMAKEIMDDLVSYGKVKRGWLGVSVQKLTPEIAKAYKVKEEGGIIIGDVFKDSAAAKAGVKRGDVVMKLNGEHVEDTDWFVQHVRSLAPGSTAKLDIIRGGKKMTIKVKLDERPDSPDGKSESKSDDDKDSGSASEVLKELGLEVSPINDRLIRAYRLDSSAEGLVITDVDPSSAARTAGLRKGDILRQVNGRDVSTLDDLQEAAGSDGSSAVLMIERSGQTFIVSISK